MAKSLVQTSVLKSQIKINQQNKLKQIITKTTTAKDLEIINKTNNNDCLFLVTKCKIPKTPSVPPNNNIPFSLLNPDISTNNVQLPLRAVSSVPKIVSKEPSNNLGGNELFFVDKNSLKRVLSPNLKSGIYKTFVAEKKNERISSSKDAISNEILDLKDSNKTDSELIKNEGECKSAPDSKGDALSYLARDILKVGESNNLIFDRIKNELTHRNAKLNQKTIYRIVRPEEFNLELIPDNISSKQVKNKNSLRGRPRKGSEKRATPSIDVKPDKVASKSRLTARTRCGRVSKPPKHIEDVFKLPLNSKIIINDHANDSEFKYNKPIVQPTEPPVTNSSTKRERNIPNDYRCTVCNKIYLGKGRMLRHFEAHPDHFTKTHLQQTLNDMSLYSFLSKKVQQENLTENQRNKIFLDEITDLVDQLQARRQQIINNDSEMYFISSRAANLLGIEEGHFGLNSSAVTEQSLPNRENIATPTLNAPPPPPRLDYNLSISLSEPNTTDDMLLQTVDDLVKEKLKILMNDDDGIVVTRGPPRSVVHYDHASDNAVEAVTMKETQPPPIIDLSLDLFQFNNN